MLRYVFIEITLEISLLSRKIKCWVWFVTSLRTSIIENITRNIAAGRRNITENSISHFPLLVNIIGILLEILKWILLDILVDILLEILQLGGEILRRILIVTSLGWKEVYGVEAVKTLWALSGNTFSRTTAPCIYIRL